MADGIDHLIINSAYEEPKYHWLHDDNGQTFHKEPGRRQAGYFIMGQGSNQYNDVGQFVPLPLVNRIRPRVKAWRELGFPGVTGVTRDALGKSRNATVSVLLLSVGCYRNPYLAYRGSG